MARGADETFEAMTNLGDPQWAKETSTELLKIALRGRCIDSADHVVIRELWGQQ